MSDARIGHAVVFTCIVRKVEKSWFNPRSCTERNLGSDLSIPSLPVSVYQLSSSSAWLLQ